MAGLAVKKKSKDKAAAADNTPLLSSAADFESSVDNALKIISDVKGDSLDFSQINECVNALGDSIVKLKGQALDNEILPHLVAMHKNFQALDKAVTSHERKLKKQSRKSGGSLLVDDEMGGLSEAGEDLDLENLQLFDDETPGFGGISNPLRTGSGLDEVLPEDAADAFALAAEGKVEGVQPLPEEFKEKLDRLKAGCRDMQFQAVKVLLEPNLKLLSVRSAKEAFTGEFQFLWKFAYLFDANLAELSHASTSLTNNIAAEKVPPQEYLDLFRDKADWVSGFSVSSTRGKGRGIERVIETNWFEALKQTVQVLKSFRQTIFQDDRPKDSAIFERDAGVGLLDQSF